MDEPIGMIARALIRLVWQAYRLRGYSVTDTVPDGSTWVLRVERVARAAEYDPEWVSISRLPVAEPVVG